MVNLCEISKLLLTYYVCRIFFEDCKVEGGVMSLRASSKSRLKCSKIRHLEMFGSTVRWIWIACI